MKVRTNLIVHDINPNGGLVVSNEILHEYNGEIIFEECNEEEYNKYKKLEIGQMINLPESEKYKNVKFEIINLELY